jgi:glucans biosynthesis protein
MPDSISKRDGSRRNKNPGMRAHAIALAILITAVAGAVVAQSLPGSSTSSVTQSSPISSTATTSAGSQTSSSVMAADDHQALFAAIEGRARTLAGETYRPPKVDMPRELADMNYEQYRSILFRPEAAVWRNESLFELQLFHPGFLYKEPVVLHMAGPGSDAIMQFKQEYFNYVGLAEPIAGKVPATMGFAGFRVHYPLNSNEYKSEFLVFLGASYFRLIGPGQVYGISARGLAIDTAEPSGEEFPVFREFWLLKPQPQQTHLVIYALLDSPSVAGAYRFEVTPGAPTEMLVEARLFARKDVKKLGIAPLTSMYLHGENHVRPTDDFRPEVHDSDGVLLAASNGEWIWRPLSNHRALRISSLMDENPRGFGMLQRDRDFNHYMDMEALYHLRPSLWVTPQGDWGKGRVELVEIPTDTEVHDNMVAYWVPEQPLKAGEQRNFSYRLRSFDHHLPEQNTAKVVRTLTGWGAIPGQSNPPPRSKRQFAVDFSGAELENLPADAPLEAVFENTSGSITDLMVRQLPDKKTWRASFKLEPDGNKTVDMRLAIKLRDQRLTEVWSYVWYPDAVQ